MMFIIFYKNLPYKLNTIIFKKSSNNLGCQTKFFVLRLCFFAFKDLLNVKIEHPQVADEDPVGEDKVDDDCVISHLHTS